MLKRKEKKNLNYLEMTPIRKYNHIEKENGLIDVLVPRFTSRFAVKYILPRMKNPYFKANLDEYGSYLWLSIDNKRKVYEIIKLMEEKFGETLQPITERALLFFTQLYNAGFINFYELNRR